MSVKTLPAVMLLSVSVFTGVANAKDGLYISAFGGITAKNSSKIKATSGEVFGDVQFRGEQKFDSAMPLGAAVGFNAGNLAFDVSYTTMKSKLADANLLDGFKVKSEFLLANAYLHFADSDSIIRPYIGAGAGIARTKMSESNTDLRTDFKDVLAYQFAAGSKFLVSEHVQFFADVRYTATLKKDVSGHINNDNLNSNPKYKLNYYSANVGISYIF